MRESDLRAKFTVHGLWWLPENPSLKLPGILSVGGSGNIRLKLFGALGSGGLLKFPIVIGTSDREKLYTLADAYEMTRPLEPHRQTVATSEIGAERVYVGKHFLVPGDVRFTSLQVRYSDLEWWLGWSPFEVQPSGGGWRIAEENMSRRHVHFTDSTRSTTLSIWTGVSHKVSSTKRGVSYAVYLQIAPSAPASFAWFMDYLFDVRNLFTLFIGSPIFVEEATGFGDEVEYAPGAKVLEVVQIYFNTIRWRKTYPVYPTDIPVTFALIRERAEEVFHAWFSNAEKLRLVCELFFGAQYNPQMYVESEFLNFTQALEVFYRVTRDSKYVSTEQYEGYRRTLESSIPSEAPKPLRSKLKTMLKYANEHTLRDALRCLIDSLDVASKLRISTDLKAFVDDVVNNRNYQIHGDESLKGMVLSDHSPQRLEKYGHINRRLRAILTIHLLKLVGIPESQVASRVLRGL